MLIGCSRYATPRIKLIQWNSREVSDGILFKKKLVRDTLSFLKRRIRFELRKCPFHAGEPSPKHRQEPLGGPKLLDQNVFLSEKAQKEKYPFEYLAKLYVCQLLCGCHWWSTGKTNIFKNWMKSSVWWNEFSKRLFSWRFSNKKRLENFFGTKKVCLLWNFEWNFESDGTLEMFGHTVNGEKLHEVLRVACWLSNW